jgi:hypothetical protein
MCHCQCSIGIALKNIQSNDQVAEWSGARAHLSTRHVAESNPGTQQQTSRPTAQPIDSIAQVGGHS